MAFPGGFKEYMAVKRQKLEVQAEAIAAKSSQSDIFAGVILYFNGFLGSVGLTMLEMKELVLIHGAMVRDKLEGEVTHIIASQMTDSKMIQLRKPVVRPEWLTESINAGRQLPWNPYRLYTNLEASQKTLNAFMTDQRASPQKPSYGSPGEAGKSASTNYVISASQVDMNVVNELPEELRKEIMAEVARARTASSSTWQSPSTPKRKKKFSPKRDFFPSVSQVDREVWNAIPASLQRDVLVDMKLVHDQKRLPNSTSHRGMLDASSAEAPVLILPHHGPSLGGESDIKEIRAMLLSWIEGYPDGPPAEDVSAAVAYLTQLIQDLQMDVAQSLLAWLRVNVVERYDLTTEGPWCVILNEISSEVDQAVQRGYGCSLKFM
ncbi:deoxycytidyl transferase [Gaertneriomyces sp. JEL0708]|nr:deoxycytidyl transferase [Gaertneriomyces sp. JEL0708]